MQWFNFLHINELNNALEGARDARPRSRVARALARQGITLATLYPNMRFTNILCDTLKKV